MTEPITLLPVATSVCSVPSLVTLFEPDLKIVKFVISVVVKLKLPEVTTLVVVELVPNELLKLPSLTDIVKGSSCKTCNNFVSATFTAKPPTTSIVLSVDILLPVTVRLDAMLDGIFDDEFNNNPIVVVAGTILGILLIPVTVVLIFDVDGIIDSIIIAANISAPIVDCKDTLLVILFILFMLALTVNALARLDLTSSDGLKLTVPVAALATPSVILNAILPLPI